MRQAIAACLKNVFTMGLRRFRGRRGDGYSGVSLRGLAKDRTEMMKRT